ncbi:alpha/beta hydrolase [Streptacidiphilus sp. N1-10]|uniref:Alpha/beta hydrolase n=1 Tax=Streptacidiphilus jeojiensis TaxID=3229225 RepID=A0ABV6XU12_9ACTN
MSSNSTLVTQIESPHSTEGKPLALFLPGLSGNNRQWDSVLALMSEKQVQLAYGAPILAHSAFDGARPGVVQLGRAMDAELRARGHDGDVVVVTHSVGAFVALAMAHEAPDVVKSLVIVNGGLTSVARFIDSPLRQLYRHPSSSWDYLRLFALVGAPVPGALKRAIASRRWSSRAVAGRFVSDAAMESAEQREALIAEAGKFETLFSLRQNRHHWHEFQAYAPEIRTPVHFIVGDRDPMTSERDTRVMAGLLPNAEVTVLRGVGHAAPLEAAQTVATAIEAALEA